MYSIRFTCGYRPSITALQCRCVCDSSSKLHVIGDSFVHVSWMEFEISNRHLFDNVIKRDLPFQEKRYDT